MDQLTAYRILQLMPGSTRREIREAYARLAKEYHPEEHPKEFNQIQEAYQLLTGRGEGENWSSDAGDDWFSDGEKTESEWESEKTCDSDTRWKEEEEQEESEESEEASDQDFEENEVTGSGNTAKKNGLAERTGKIAGADPPGNPGFAV